MKYPKRKRIFVGCGFILLLVVLVIFGILAYVDFMSKRQMCDGVVSPNAWLDTNRNGLVDEGEKPLAGVCIWSNFNGKPSIPCGPTFLTDSLGRWQGGDDPSEMDFMPGTCCNEIWIYAFQPNGYQATTPLKVNNCVARFGFVSLLPTSTP
jgi:hypothetical protein